MNFAAIGAVALCVLGMVYMVFRVESIKADVRRLKDDVSTVYADMITNQTDQVIQTSLKTQEAMIEELKVYSSDMRAKIDDEIRRIRRESNEELSAAKQDVQRTRDLLATLEGQ